MSDQSSPVDRLPAVTLSDLYRDHARWLGAMLWRRFGKDEAEDLVQETYSRLAPGLVTDLRNPRALLLRVATRIVRDRARRPPLTGPLADLSDFPVGGAQHEQLLLKQILLTMPAPLREVFLLHRVDGLAYADIAVRLTLSIKTVEWRMSRALAHCARCLRD